MIRSRLSRLERAAKSLGAGKCTHCGGIDGVGGVPLVTIMGKWEGNDYTTYNADRCCPRCGAKPPDVVDIVIVGKDHAETDRTGGVPAEDP